MRDVRYAERFETLVARVVDGPGKSDPALRRAALTGDELPDDLVTYIEKVSLHAYKVTDADVANLKAAGYSEDEIFELTVAAAVGAGVSRYEAGMRAMRG